MPFLIAMFLFIFAAHGIADQWEFIGLPGMEIMSIECNCYNSSCIYAGTYIYGLYMTADGGENWHYKIATNVPVSYIGTDPHSPPTLYALVNDSYSAGIYSSTDNGET